MKRAICISTIALACLCGCSSDPVRAPYTAAKDQLARQDYPEVVYQDSLDEELVVHEEPVVERSAGSQSLHVRLTLRSISDDPINFRVQFLFYGEGGQPLTDNPVWKQFNVAPRSKVIIEGDSIASRAIKWEAQVRR